MRWASGPERLNTVRRGSGLISRPPPAVRIRVLGLEVAHILHAGDIGAVHLRNAPHVLLARLHTTSARYAGPGDRRSARTTSVCALLHAIRPVKIRPWRSRKACRCW